MITLAAKLVGTKLAPFLVYGVAVLALLGALWWLRSDAYSDGQRHERAAWERKAADMKAKAESLQRRADQIHRDAEALQQAAIARNRQEIDDAVRNIPDQALSARQRARVCAELRRRRPPAPAEQLAAACGPAGAS